MTATVTLFDQITFHRKPWGCSIASIGLGIICSSAVRAFSRRSQHLLNLKGRNGRPGGSCCRKCVANVATTIRLGAALEAWLTGPLTAGASRRSPALLITVRISCHQFPSTSQRHQFRSVPICSPAPASCRLCWRSKARNPGTAGTGPAASGHARLPQLRISNACSAANISGRPANTMGRYHASLRLVGQLMLV
jgi:hypothetical protein